jgi:uncharacterized protein
LPASQIVAEASGQKNACGTEYYRFEVNSKLTLSISIDAQALRAFCQPWVIELDLFGSVLRPDFRADSDVDVLVSFHEDRRPTLFTLVEMEEQLDDLFGRRGDLVVRQSVERSQNFIRQEHILAHRQPIHVARSGLLA